MDSMDLEREKGITIHAKNAARPVARTTTSTSSTPRPRRLRRRGRARHEAWSTACCCVVDAFDGPQAQTQLRAHARRSKTGLKPIVVINKIDRDNADPHKVLDMVFELFIELHATDEQLDFPVIYASAKRGLRQERRSARHEHHDGAALRGHHQAHPAAQRQSDCELLPDARVATSTTADYLGRIAFGRIVSGSVSWVQGVHLHRIRRQAGAAPRSPRSSAIQGASATIEVTEASAGDIVGHLRLRRRLHRRDAHRHRRPASRSPSSRSIRRRSAMQICINDGPLVGKEGKLAHRPPTHASA